MDDTPKQLVEVAQRLKVGDAPRRHKVRAVLKWFGASRRGANVLSDINTALANIGIQTNRVLDDAGIDERIRFVVGSAQMGDDVENSKQPQVQVSSIDDRPPAMPESPNAISDAP